MSAIDKLPDYWANSNFLYALEFSDGVVKIGCSFKPRSRAQQLQNEYGKEVVRCTASQHGSATVHLAERDALRAAALVGTPVKRASEFFTGLPFETAAELIRQAAESKPARRAGPHFSQTKEGRKAAAQRKQQRAEARAAEVFGRLLDALVAPEPMKVA